MPPQATRQKKPFAQQLGLFYRAPLSAISIFVAAAGGVADAWLAAGDVGPIDMFLMLAVAVAELRYALGLLRRFSLGYFDLSTHLAEMDSHPYTVYKALIGLFALGIGASLVRALMPPLGWAIMVAAVSIAPALVMRTTAYNSLLAGLSVPGWLQLIGVMKSGYAWLLGMCLLVLFGSGLTAAGLAWLGGGGLMSDALASTVSNYALFVAFCMMGYALFEHSDRLGIETRYEQGERLGLRPRDRAPAQATVQDLLSQGEVAAALEVAREDARLAPSDPKSQERYFKLLELRGSDEKLPLQAGRWLKACADAQRTHDSATLVEKWWTRHPDMLDEWPQSFLRAAQLASKAGLLQEPLQMVGYFRKIHSGSMLMSQALLLEAEHRLSRLQDPAGAKATLLDLMQRFPKSDEAVVKAQSMLNVMEAVARGPSGLPPPA